MTVATEAMNRTRHPPGPRGHFIFGSGAEIGRNPVEFYLRMQREYGDIVRIRVRPNSYQYLIAHPAGVEHVLQSNQQNYRKGSSFNKPVSMLTGKGLVTSEGVDWRGHRRLTQPAFNHQRFPSYMTTIASLTEAMLERWDAYAENGQPLDVDAEMYQLALRIAGQTLCGTDLSKHLDEFGPALRVALEHIGYRMSHRFAWPEIVPTYRSRNFKRAMRILDKVAYEIIADRRKQNIDAGDLLSMLMLARDKETGEGLTDQQLRDEVITFLVGGHESGAAALTWTWYLLAQHSDVIDKLRSELEKTLRGRIPKLEDLPGLPYSRMILEEAMRLYPPAWRHQRETINNDEIGGYAIPSQSTIIICQYVTHRHPEVWHEPTRFIPERFEPEQIAARPQFAYFPFGGGARQCIGNSFAVVEAQIIIAMVAQRFLPRLVPHQVVRINPAFTLRPNDGLLITI